MKVKSILEWSRAAQRRDAVQMVDIDIKRQLTAHEPIPHCTLALSVPGHRPVVPASALKSSAHAGPSKQVGPPTSVSATWLNEHEADSGTVGGPAPQTISALHHACESACDTPQDIIQGYVQRALPPMLTEVAQYLLIQAAWRCVLNAQVAEGGRAADQRCP